MSAKGVFWNSEQHRLRAGWRLSLQFPTPAPTATPTPAEPAPTVTPTQPLTPTP